LALLATGGIVKVLIVLTSDEQLGDTGEKTGFWLEEFAGPYYTLSDAGAELTLASPAANRRSIPGATRPRRRPMRRSGSIRIPTPGRG
jgi:putative intracellular protease/amidase